MGNIYTNNWASPTVSEFGLGVFQSLLALKFCHAQRRSFLLVVRDSQYMVSVENTQLRGGGSNLKNRIWDAARPTLESWTGMKLQPTSLYGIRVYTEGAILSPHVDRLPLVSSCIINVAQDVDEDWILEVYDRHDNAVNGTSQND